jgi:hypothetical protein
VFPLALLYRIHVRHFLFALLAAVLTARAVAEETWTITTSDFRRVSGSIVSIDAAGARLTSPDSTLPLDALLRLDRNARAAAAPPKLSLFFQNNDRLGGEPTAIKNDALTWSSPVIGALTVPLQKLRGLSRLATPPGLDEERKEDVVSLANHDVVRGVLSAIEEGKAVIQSGADALPIPFPSVETILLAGPPREVPSTQRGWRIRLVDGSILTAPAIRIAAGKLQFRLPAAVGDADLAADLANVLSLEQVNGPVSWLSDRTPTANRQEPFNAESNYPARMDQNVFGRQLRVGAQAYEKGIGVHANSTLTFALDGTYKLLRTRYGIDTSSDASKAAVNVRILLDGRVVHEKKDFRAFKTSPLLTIELGNARELTLEVTAAGPTDTQDRLDWIEPALVRDLTPAAATAPASAPAATTRAVADHP